MTLSDDLNLYRKVMLAGCRSCGVVLLNVNPYEHFIGVGLEIKIMTRSVNLKRK